MKKMIKMLLCLMMAMLLCPCVLAEEADLMVQLSDLEAEIAATETKLADLQRQHAETLVALKLAQGATVVKMEIADYGVIFLELYPETAPSPWRTSSSW